MSIEAIPAIGLPTDIVPLDASDPALGVADAGGGSFATVLQDLQGLNSEMVANDKAVSQLALGQSDNLHQVIMHSEQTRLDFELLLAVRNKVLEAYQELMRMQV